MTDSELDTSAGLHLLMERATSDLPVPTHRIHEGSRRRGRAVRRRRRLGATAGALAATVVAAGIAWPSVAGDQGADAHRAHDPGPAATSGRDERPSGWWNMPGSVMRDRLATLLPAGLSIADANLGDQDLAPGEEPSGGWLAVDLVEADGQPAGGVNVVLYPPADGQDAFVRDTLTCPGNLTDPASCTELHDSTGALIGRTSRWADRGVVVLEATRLTPEGAVVYAGSSNSSDDKWGLGSSVDQATPSVRLSDLRRLTEAPSWRDWVDRD